LKAAVYLAKDLLKIMDVKYPKPGSKEVVVKVKAAGICTTDLKILSGAAPQYRVPFILGHEVAGVVHEVGESVGEIAAGMRVAIYPIAACGSCYFCQRGMINLCENEIGFGHGIDGGFAEYVRVPEKIVRLGGIVEIKGLSYEEGVMIEPLSCAVNSIEKCRIRKDDLVLIVGCGPMGLLNLMVAKSYGSKVVSCDLLDRRLKMAERLGADYVANPQQEDLRTVVNRLTNGRGVDALIVAVGDPKLVEGYHKMVRKGGIVNVFGGPPKGSLITLDPRFIHYSEVSITGSFASSIDHYKAAKELIKSKKVDVKSLVTHRFSLDKILDAVKLASRAEMLKGCIVF
jgi:L-iditol 2-dehydrogenase